MLKKGLLLFIPLIFVFSTLQAQQFNEGVEYERIKTPVKTSDPGKVVVTEMFWYGCPHCYRFEPYIEKWKQNIPQDVVFEQLPSVLNPSWMEHARAYFALEAMGAVDKVHQKFFTAIHLQNKRLNSLDTIAAFVADQGVDEKAFRNHYHSFPIDSKVRKSRQTEKKYGHGGVPAIIVNGKYRTSASLAGSNANMIKVIDFLVKKELAEIKK